MFAYLLWTIALLCGLYQFWIARELTTAWHRLTRGRDEPGVTRRFSPAWLWPYAFVAVQHQLQCMYSHS